MIRLRLWADLQPMGWFAHEAGEFFLEYDDLWLANPEGYPLAPQFALSNARPLKFYGQKVESTSLNACTRAPSRPKSMRRR